MVHFIAPLVDVYSLWKVKTCTRNDHSRLAEPPPVAGPSMPPAAAAALAGLPAAAPTLAPRPAAQVLSTLNDISSGMRASPTPRPTTARRNRCPPAPRARTWLGLGLELLRQSSGAAGDRSSLSRTRPQLLRWLRRRRRSAAGGVLVRGAGKRRWPAARPQAEVSKLQVRGKPNLRLGLPQGKSHGCGRRRGRPKGDGSRCRRLCSPRMRCHQGSCTCTPAEVHAPRGPAPLDSTAAAGAAAGGGSRPCDGGTHALLHRPLAWQARCALRVQGCALGSSSVR